MKYLNYKIVCQELPNKISLLFNITNCSYACYDCHSPELQQDVGEVLTPSVFETILVLYNNMIDCVIFFGGYHEKEALKELLKICKSHNLLTNLWTGASDISKDVLKLLDYIKTGPYSKKLGGLDHPETTNQKYIEVKTGKEIKLMKHLKNIPFEADEHIDNKCIKNKSLNYKIPIESKEVTSLLPFNISEPILIQQNGNVIIPKYAHDTDSGADIYASQDIPWEPIFCDKIKVGYRAHVKTDLCLKLPLRIDAEIRSRSGLAKKYNIKIGQGVGTIDNGYLGECIVMLEILGDLPNDEQLNPVVKKGTRVAQIVFHHFMQGKFELTKEFTDKTTRGEGGFGSSGIK